jgi:predicted enzyme related to lactoylglutathione lyase
MSKNQVGSETAVETPKARGIDMKLEIAVIPVSDVDRAKAFYSKLGWRLDADFADGDDFRVIQFTPPGSGASIIFGKNVTTAAPGSAQGLYLIVSDLEAARKELINRGIGVSEAFPAQPACTQAQTSPICLAGTASAVRIPSMAATARSPRSRIRTATAGCSRKSPRDCPDALTPTRRSPRRANSRPRSGVRGPRMASTRRSSASTMRIGRTGMPTTWSASRPASSRRHS